MTSVHGRDAADAAHRPADLEPDLAARALAALSALWGGGSGPPPPRRDVVGSPPSSAGAGLR
ncbi:hypothetical protein FB470_004214 [Amycolatopsis thermophila]|uniref:Uncharacterized protein n=1 Tax=Amycolatopsis thermophila TaxID=206084 RepID=A0ABU0EY26_9PSEU|nr:hypothetical protein [Amycolatopsis thermophila]